MAAYYDDLKFSYLDYWRERQYEHGSELIAIGNLLGKRKFGSLVDLGGGYGRLVREMVGRAEHIYLVEPSLKQRVLAKDYLEGKQISILAGSAQKTSFAPLSIDCVVMVRVAHHLPNIQPALTEIYRILKSDGLLIFEFANSNNIKARLRGWIFNTPIPRSPIDLRTPANRNEETIAFVNHHPAAIVKSLKSAGFTPRTILSVSNFRAGLVKKIVPLKILLGLERLSQRILGPVFYGPSIFILAEKSVK